MIGHNSPPAFAPSGGWIAIARSMRGHPLVGFHLFAKPCDPTKGAMQPALAFIDLLMECRYENGYVMNGGRKMEVKRGQLVGAVSWLAARWNWTPMAVRVWLDKLQADAMISRHVPGASNDNKHVGRAAAIITLCNYDQYQGSATNEQQTEQQTNSNQITNEQQQYKDNKGTREQESPPTPSGGGAQQSKRKRGLSAAQIKLTDHAFDQWNETAKRLGFGQVEARTDARRARLAKRLEDIGGLDRFSAALSAIARVPFLMGQIPPKPGQAPFKLDIDRLLQTDGNLGDVLAKLIDKAGDANELVGPNGKRWGWWRGREAEYRAMPVDYWRKLDADCKPNGTWPWWLMGAPPGHAECIMPPELIAERGYVEIYNGQITHS